jgi:glycine dehydrogenase subunit 1
MLAGKLDKLEGFSAPRFKGHHFNEFVLESKIPVYELNEQLYQKGIQGGLCLKEHFPELGESMLIAVTEMHSVSDLNRFAQTLTEITGGGGGT